MVWHWEDPISQFRNTITTKVHFLEKSNFSFTFAQVSQELRALFWDVEATYVKGSDLKETHNAVWRVGGNNRV